MKLCCQIHPAAQCRNCGGQLCDDCVVIPPKGRPHCPYCKWKHTIFSFPLTKEFWFTTEEDPLVKKFPAESMYTFKTYYPPYK